jgi:glycogen debranching enzyme
VAKITITQDNLLTSAEFKKKLEEIEENASSMDDMLDLMREMIAFERQYNMPSDEFYARFMRGEMGDARAVIQWAIRYELYLNIKEEIESHMNAITGGHHVDKVLVPAV